MLSRKGEGRAKRRAPAKRPQRAMSRAPRLTKDQQLSHHKPPEYTDGEASNPGPHHGPARLLTAMTTNMSSLNTQFEQVCALPAHVVGGQETRMTATGQQLMKSDLEKRGWDVVFGRPVEKRGRGRGSVKPGGVCILARTGLGLQVVQASCDLGRELWESRRFVHAAIPTGTGKTVLHFISFYGVTNAHTDPNARAENERLLSLLLKYVAQLGQVPVLLFGDWNTTLTKSQSLLGAVQNNHLADLELEASLLENREPTKTCFVRGTSVGSRIDMLFASPSLAGASKNVRTLGKDATGIPTHKVVAVDLDIQHCSQSIHRFSVPSPIPPWEADPDKDAEEHLRELALDACMRPPEEWDELIQEGDVDRIFAAISEDSERYLWCRHTGGETWLPPCKRGRGQKPRLLKKDLTATHQDLRGALDIRAVRVGKLAGRCEELVRKLHNRHVLDPMPQDWHALWQTCRQDGSELFPTWTIWAQQPQLPDIGFLRELTGQLREHLHHENAQSKERRAKSWEGWFSEDWSTQRKHTHAFVRGDDTHACSILARPDGTATGNHREMDDLLQNAWKPIFRIYDESSPPLRTGFLSALWGTPASNERIPGGGGERRSTA